MQASTQQSINLYKHLEQEEEPLCSATHMLMAAVLTLALMILYALFSFYQQYNIEKKVERESSQEEQLQTTLAQLNAEKNGAPAADEAELEGLKNKIILKRRILKYMTGGNVGHGEFSEYLEGLSRQHPKGLWLEEIAIKNAGKDIRLQGVMTKASLLPDYLTALGSEETFQGLKFNLMKIEDIEKQQQSMRFEIKVNREESADL